MIEFALDVSAVMTGLAIYDLIRRKFHERRYYSNYDEKFGTNW